MVKVKVTLQATGQSTEFDLNKDAPIAGQLEQLCQQLNAQGNKAEYVLQLEGGQAPLQQQVRQSCSNFSLPNFFLLY